jgi:hypothetical protein
MSNLGFVWWRRMCPVDNVDIIHEYVNSYVDTGRRSSYDRASVTVEIIVRRHPWHHPGHQPWHHREYQPQGASA